MTSSDPAISLLEHAAFVRSLALRLAGPDAGPDLAQDTLLAAHRSPPPRGGNPRGFLATVAQNLWRNRVRDEVRERRRRAQAAVVASTDAPSAADILRREEVRRQVVAAVLALRQPLQRVVLLRYYEGLDSAAIGARLQLSPSTVRTHLQRATAELRQRLDRDHGGDRAAWAGPLLLWAQAPEALPVLGTAVSLRAAAAAALVLACGAALWLWGGQPMPASATTAAVAAAASPGAAAAARVQQAAIEPAPPPVAGERVAVGSPPADDWRPRAPLRGVVLDARTRAPLGGMTVRLRGVAAETSLLQTPAAAPDVDRTVASGDDGAFAFDAVPAGDYAIAADGDGVAARRHLDFAPDGPDVELLAGPATAGDVRVRVVDADGMPVAGADVRVALSSRYTGGVICGWGGRPALTGTTATDGAVSLRLPDDAPTCDTGGAVAVDGRGRVGSTWGGGGADGSAFCLTVTLQPPGAITGRLTGRSDWRGVGITAHQSKGMIAGTPVFEWRGAVAADGAFRVDALPPGTYRLQVTGAAVRRDGEQFWNRPATVVGAGEQVVSVPPAIECAPCGVVRGRVVDSAGRPVAGAVVTARLPVMNGHLDAVLHHAERTNTYFYKLETARSAADGSYAFDASPGSWQVVVTAPPLAMDVRLGVEVAAGAAVELRHTMVRGGGIGGYVERSTTLWCADEPAVKHQVQNEGVFELRDLRPGPWRTDDGRTVDVVAGEMRWLAPAARIERVHRGVLLCEGEPVVGYDVRAGDRGDTATTGADGAFQVVGRWLADETPELNVLHGGLRVVTLTQTDGVVELPCHRIDIRAVSATGAPIAALVEIGSTFDRPFGRDEVHDPVGRLEVRDGLWRGFVVEPRDHLTAVATFADGGRARQLITAATRELVLRQTPTGVVEVHLRHVDGTPCAGGRVEVLPWGRAAPEPQDPMVFAADCADAGAGVAGRCGGDGVVLVRGVPPGAALVNGWPGGGRARAASARVATVVAGDRTIVEVVWLP